MSLAPQEQPLCCGAYLGTACGLKLLLQSASHTEITGSGFQVTLKINQVFNNKIAQTSKLQGKFGFSLFLFLFGKVMFCLISDYTVILDLNHIMEAEIFKAA